MGDHVGCEALARRLELVKPRLHVFGHIHSSYGVAHSGATLCVNACLCVDTARPLNHPIVADLSAGGLALGPSSLTDARTINP
jgi:hypothetical protein